jgi:hypothetical protein
MRLQLRSKDFAFRRHLWPTINRSLRLTLGRFGGRINCVTVYLTELSHRPGEIERRCRIVVGLIGSGQICCEDAGTDLKAAVNRAVVRVGKAVEREMENRRESETRGMRTAIYVSGV